jgi:hypothetical protein
MRTQNNFYKSKNLLDTSENKATNLQQSTDLKQISGPGAQNANIHEAGQNINYAGDRVPTRERQYRSAHQNVRRRDITR